MAVGLIYICICTLRNGVVELQVERAGLQKFEMKNDAR
jgi:hypothetical protein